MATAEKRTLSIEARLKDKLTQELGPMERKLVQFATAGHTGLKKLLSGFLSLKTAVVGLAAAYVGWQTVAYVRSVAEQADAIVKLARSTGDMVENLSELQVAMELAGVKAEEFQGVIRGLENAAKQAVTGNASYAKTFADLGVTLDDLRSTGPSEIFDKLAKGLERFSGEQDKALKLAQLLPDKYLQLLPLLGQGSEAFRKAILDARAAGATVTEAEAVAAEQLNDAFSKVQKAIGSVARALVVAFGPQGTAILETLTKTIVANKEAFVGIAKAIGDGIVKAINLAIDALIGFVAVIESVPGVNLIGEDLARQRALLEREIFQTRNMILQGLDFSGSLKKQLADAEKSIVDIDGKLGRGLAGALREQKKAILDQIGNLADQFKQAQPEPKSPDQTAAVLGLPSSSDLQAYVAEVEKVTRPEASTPNPFRPTQNREKLSEPGAEPINRDQERLAIMRQLAQLNPDLQVFKNTLREIDQQTMELQLKDAFDNGTISTKEFAAALELVRGKFKELKSESDGFWGGFKAGAKQALRQWTDWAAAGKEAASQLIDSGLNGLTDAFADIITGTKKAKDAFKDLAKQMLGDLARILSKMIVMKGVEALFGGSAGGGLSGFFAAEKGGIFPGGVELRKFAQGGIANGPTLGLFGEGNRREAFVPLPDNRSIPVSFVGGGAGGGTQILNLHISAWDGKDVRRTLAEHQNFLMSLWSNQAETRNGVRQVIRKVAS